MNPETAGIFFAGLVVGALAGWALSILFRSTRSQTAVVEAAGRLSAAEAAARLEEERRQELERELEGVRTELAQLDRDAAVAKERAEQADALIAELKDFRERSRKDLEDSFKVLAAEALAGSHKQFLNLAEQRLATSEERSKAELEERKKAVETLLAPLQKTLQSLDQKSQDMEKARVDAYSRIDQQVQLLAQATSGLQDKTTSLTTALKSSQVRGRWGEIALRNVAELAGMAEHCDFDEQIAIAEGKRPDMIVKLPGGRRIAVDAKAPLTDFLAAAEAPEEAGREAALDRHVKALRAHVKGLASRDYAAALKSDLDLVVMFLPGEQFLSAAFAQDPDLQVDALRAKVLIATPTTLVALLRTVAIYWQQRSLAENAEAIAEVARELYQRAAKFSEDLERLGKGLSTALGAYNSAVGSFDRRLLPMARRLEQLKVSEQTKRDLRAPEPIEGEPRKLSS
jgi:DNA recombination protein RmuC